MKLLTSNSKLDKEVSGYQSIGLQLAPAKTSGYNVCQFHTEECARHCVFHTGMGKFHSVQDARVRRTLFFFRERQKFLGQLRKEMRTFVKKCNKSELRPAVRLNVFSDLPWEKIDAKLFEEFPNVSFYDYTKDAHRALSQLKKSAQWPRNYELTFSWSGENPLHCIEILNAGGNIAIPFQENLPRKFLKYRVVDGDKHDLRLREVDGRNVIIGLRAKGTLKHEASVFKVSNEEMK